MAGATLHQESFSPWSEKARWALDHHGVPYRTVEHVPLLGEPTLRIAARRLGGPVSVPLLVDGEVILMSSRAIAEHAERRGGGRPLFVAEGEVDAWDARSEAIMRAGRALLLPRLRESPEALAEQLPPFVPRALRPALRGLAATGIRYLASKYGTDAASAEAHERVMREELDALREALAGGRVHLVGDTLSYADITMATSLQFVRPVADRFIALGAASRAAWTHPHLARAYADLLAWRDALYDAHRAPRT